MEIEAAIECLAALAQKHRLNIFRLLIKEGPNGLRAGEIAQQLGISPSALSFHLSQLEGAGLLRSWRVQRSILYAVELRGIRGLLVYLTEDCCQGRPEICGGLTNLSPA